MIVNDFLNALKDITSPFHYLLRRRIAYYFYYNNIKSIMMNANEEKLRGIYKPINLLEIREFRGMINSLLQPDSYYFSVKDIAVTINIATNHFSDNSFNKESHEIIDFSYHILSEIKGFIMSNKVIKDELNGYGKDLSFIDENSDRKEIEFLFKNKKELFKHYFSTFTDRRYNHTIKIWHQGNNSVSVDWSEEDSIYVNINPRKIREGFFLTGFDYYNVTGSESLLVATNKHGYEFFNKEIEGGSYIWVQ